MLVDDIPDEHYLWICEDAAKLGITPDDYLTQMVKEYARELLDKKRATAMRMAKELDDGTDTPPL